MTEGYLGFDYANVGYVIDGQEDATVRYDLEREFEPGQAIDLVTPGGTVFATAEVDYVAECEVREALDVIDRNVSSHPAPTTHGLARMLNEHYSRKLIRAGDSVTVIGFELLDGRWSE